ncbi:MAG: S8 family peptidase [Myxococcales bacterium]|nr:S8 family peptidase [Myxococcales bacterium]
MAAPRDRQHIFLSPTVATQNYASPRQGGGPKELSGPHDRPAHAKALEVGLSEAIREAGDRRMRAQLPIDPERVGMYLTFESSKGIELNLEGLQNPSKGIELVACVREGDHERATVYVPDSQRGFFFERLQAYERSTGRRGETNYRDVIDRVSAVRLATLRALWTDGPDTFPAIQEQVWWEVWLRRTDRGEVERLRHFAEKKQLAIGRRRLDFEDRIVVVLRGSAEQLSSSIDVLGDLAEVRRATESPLVFDRMPPSEQREWIKAALNGVAPPSVDGPAVCVLDTGVFQEHPLLAMALSPSDCHTVDPNWGPTDRDGHGTQMAGLALHGDLVDPLLSLGPQPLHHRLESVKILEPRQESRYELYGSITIDAVSRVEIEQPKRRRCFSLAVTTSQRADAQRSDSFSIQPTSWSAAIDALSAGRAIDPHSRGLRYDSEQTPRRLFVVSAGNITPKRVEYLDDCDTHVVEDPAHAWNALTVGASTNLTAIEEHNHVRSGWSALASEGDLSPYSRTGLLLGRTWPIKPDVVFEGGNAAEDGHGNVDFGLASLSLLTTGLPTAGAVESGLLDVSNGTSAATAQVARIAASVMAEYPHLWPETVRALVVHSARWTTAMEAHRTDKKKKVAASLARRYGYGIPSRERATRSAKDALTLVVQGELVPYLPEGRPQMDLYTLPWPREVLQSLGAATVCLRVTLSYFIEPNPARRGWRSRFRYASHGLRFALKDPTETVEMFEARVNRMARQSQTAKIPPRPSDGGWRLGPNERDRGSLHSDCWTGAAAKLADRYCVAVFPTAGWWKDVRLPSDAHRVARYALVVSIEADAVPVDVDLWTPVATQVGLVVAPDALSGISV